MVYKTFEVSTCFIRSIWQRILKEKVTGGHFFVTVPGMLTLKFLQKWSKKKTLCMCFEGIPLIWLQVLGIFPNSTACSNQLQGSCTS